MRRYLTGFTVFALIMAVGLVAGRPELPDLSAENASLRVGCQGSQPVDIDYESDAGVLGYRVSAVSLTGLNAACDGATVTLKLLNGDTELTSATELVDGRDMQLAPSPQPLAAAVTKASLTIDGRVIDESGFFTVEPGPEPSPSPSVEPQPEPSPSPPVELPFRCTGLDITNTLEGGPAEDVLTGTSSSDLTLGRGGPDSLAGYAEADCLGGNAGEDHLSGNRGPDVMLGGPGPDVLEGGLADDWLFGGAGDDILRGEDGANLLNGGPGFDRCVVEVELDRWAGCERVVRLR